MTTTEPTAPRSRRPRTMQDDLLADLRQAAPMPIARPEAERPASAPVSAPALAPAPAAAERPESTAPDTLTVEVRVTPLRWSAPSLRPRGTRTGLVLTVGPVRVSITGWGR